MKRRIDPKELTDCIDHVLVTMKRQFHDELRAGGNVEQQFAILCTSDPLTGAPIMSKSGIAVVLIVPASFANDDDKDAVAATLRGVALAGNAIASVVCFDTYMNTGAAAYEAYKRAGNVKDSKGRSEALFCCIERRGEPTRSEYAAYHKTSDGEVIFDDSQRMDGVTMEGRFGGLLPPPGFQLDQHQLEVLRSLLRSSGIQTIHGEII